MCEICKKEKGTEVHHLQHQCNSNAKNNYIKNFHKNHLANLVNICETCHKKIHALHNQHKFIKTSDGYNLSSI